MQLYFITNVHLACFSLIVDFRVLVDFDLESICHSGHCADSISTPTLFPLTFFPLVRSRSAEARRIRTPPIRQRPGARKPNVGKPQRGLKKSQRRLAPVTAAKQ